MVYNTEVYRYALTGYASFGRGDFNVHQIKSVTWAYNIWTHIRTTLYVAYKFFSYLTLWRARDDLRLMLLKRKPNGIAVFVLENEPTPNTKFAILTFSVLL